MNLCSLSLCVCVCVCVCVRERFTFRLLNQPTDINEISYWQFAIWANLNAVRSSFVQSVTALLNGTDIFFRNVGSRLLTYTPQRTWLAKTLYTYLSNDDGA